MPTANLHYRLRSMERLRYYEQPMVSLILTYAIRRPAARSAPSATRTTATRSWRQKEGPLAADAEDAVWQRRGSGFADNPPVQITPDESLSTIVA